MTKRIKAHDRTTLVLSYTQADAYELRALVQRMHLKAGKKPSLSVIARRALSVYVARLPHFWDDEIAALNEMTTPVPKPAPMARLKTDE